MHTNLFAQTFFVFIICLNLACAGVQVNEDEINESQIIEERYEIPIEEQKIASKREKLKDNSIPNLNKARFRNLEWGISLEEVLKTSKPWGQVLPSDLL